MNIYKDCIKIRGKCPYCKNRRLYLNLNPESDFVYKCVGCKRNIREDLI